MENSMSPADMKAVLDSNYPVYASNGFGNSWGGDGGWLFIILILALLGNNGWGNGFGGGFGGNNFNDGYAWLSNGQKEIMQNTNNGFDTLHLSNQIEGTRDAIHGISNQICNSTADVTSAVNNGFYGAEIAANSRQMADMQQAFNSQVATMQGFNGIQSQLSECLKKISNIAKGIFNFTNKAVGTLVA